MSDPKFELELAGVITADRFPRRVLGDQVMAEERDAFYQTVALANVAGWINKLAMRELVERLGRGKPKDGEAQP
jgi:hypothetical protein